MAYGNWSGKARRNGKRMKQWENNIPFEEEKNQHGYFNAFMGTNPYHVILGDMEYRFCGYKLIPDLVYKSIAISVLNVPMEAEDIRILYDEDGCPEFWQGSVYGQQGTYDFLAFIVKRRKWKAMLKLELKQPDGTIWKGVCKNYGFGVRKNIQFLKSLEWLYPQKGNVHEK